MDIDSNGYELFRLDRVKAKPRSKNSSVGLGMNTSLPDQNTTRNLNSTQNK
jgi:hypothetical protein